MANVTTEDDLYRRNPAREVEQFALGVVGAWLAERGQLSDTSAGHGPDFRIDYANGRVALGEVGWHQDPTIQEMWAAVFKRERHQVVDLPEGLGQWAVKLVGGASIDRLYAELPDFIGSLLVERRLDLDVHGAWPRGEHGDTARRLGVDYISRVNTEAPAQAIFFLPGGGGLVPTDPNVIVDWVEEVLDSPE